jgi:glycosyltransferase involved in cell wall biosynthesis
MMSISWIRLKILSLIKSLSGTIFINYLLHLLPKSFKYRLAKIFIFNTKKVTSNIQNNDVNILDLWGNIKYRKYSVSNIIFDPKIKILIAVGSLSVSGGTNMILEYAYALKKAGANVYIGFMRGNASDAGWHHLSKEFEIKNLATFNKQKFELGIMTWWKTVEPMFLINCDKYLYFVQSLESRFAINSEDIQEEIHAASTYLLGVPMVTVALWLQNVLTAVSASPVWRVKNGIDKKLFQILSTEELVLSQDSSDIRFLIEGAFGVPMKAVEQTLEQCQLLNLKSVTYVNPVQYNPRYSNIKYLNEVPISQMYGVYKQHDILIKMSRVEALALPPIEAFHAGCTAILSKVTGSEEYVKDGFNSMQVEVDDFAGLREKIKLIQNDNELLLTLKKGAIKTASEWPDINTTANEFASICFTILASEKLGNIKINDPKALIKFKIDEIKQSEYLSSILLNLSN